jgi:iron complex outermembrane receptor protein
MNTKLSLLVSLLLPFNVLTAEESEFDDTGGLGFYGDDDFISIAIGESQPIAKAPAVASVITAEEIGKLGAKNIDQVLETIPGLHVTLSPIYNPLFNIRGIDSAFNPQVLVLINGVSISNLFHGDRNLVWGGMPVEAISRIEVIRGPGSALYGADAFAGVINIVTKSADEIDGFSGGVSLGSFDTTRIWAAGTGSSGELIFSGILEVSTSNGSDEKVTSDAQTFFDATAGTSVSNAPGLVNLSGDQLDLRLELLYKKLTVRSGAQIRKNIGDGAGAGQALNRTNKFESNRYNIDFSYLDEDLLPNTSVKLHGSYYTTSQQVDGDFVVYPAGSTGPFLTPLGDPIFGIFPDGVIGTPEIFENHTRAGFTAQYDGVEKHDISFGSGYYHGQIDKVTEEKNFGINPTTLTPIFPGDPVVDVSDTPFVFLTEDKRENTYAYIQDVWQFSNDWELTAGLRYDHYSDFGGTTNPRLALVWSTAYELTTKFLYGEAFRAPSFAQTRAINNPLILGNIDLKPEQIKSYELAFDYRPSYDLTINMNFFYYDWTDIIQFVPDSSGSTRTAQNVGEQTGKGLEFEAKWSVSEQFKLSGNFAWQDSHDELAEAPAPNSPEKQLYLRGDWEIGHRWRVNMQANWVMDRNRSFDDIRVAPVDDYVLFDLNIRNQLSDDLEVAFIVNNLLDEDAFELSPNAMPVPFIPNDLPLAGRSFIGEIRYKF